VVIFIVIALGVNGPISLQTITTSFFH